MKVEKSAPTGFDLLINSSFQIKKRMVDARSRRGIEIDDEGNSPEDDITTAASVEKARPSEKSKPLSLPQELQVEGNLPEQQHQQPQLVTGNCLTKVIQILLCT